MLCLSYSLVTVYNVKLFGFQFHGQMILFLFHPFMIAIFMNLAIFGHESGLELATLILLVSKSTLAKSS